jgi:serine/threonine protein kinase
MPSSVAIKYLVTPTSKTLSASGEHDLIEEVGQLQKIEEAESSQHEQMQYMRVPHPYFYYQKGKTQCYAMEVIDGINLLEGMENRYPAGLSKEEMRDSLKDLDQEILMSEVDQFLDTMHTICIHGDVKPANFMVSREGKFYMIDFGQSTLAINVDEKSGPAFENLKDEEKKNAKQAIRYFLDALKRD